jgi:hypothetical protein
MFENENNLSSSMSPIQPEPYNPQNIFDAIAFLLQSVADEENALAKLINSEKNKIIREIELVTSSQQPKSTISKLIETNNKVEESLRNIVKKNIVLALKTQEVLDLAPRVGVKACNVDTQLIHILGSIANEETRLGSLIEAEATKLNVVSTFAQTHGQLLEANNSVQRMLRTIIKKEIVLESKLQSISDFFRDHPGTGSGVCN